MSQIIALTGPQASGKDSVADILVNHGYTRLAFADPLRAEIVFAFGCDKSLLTDRDQKDLIQPALAMSQCSDILFATTMIARHTITPENHPGALEAWLEQPRTPRWIMQQWGTEYRRQLFGQDYWRKQLLGQLTAVRGDVVITDCRFDDEAEFCTKSLDAEIWRITRPGYEPKPGHISEIPVANYWVDRWIDNNGTLECLRHTTEQALAYLRHSSNAAA